MQWLSFLKHSPDTEACQRRTCTDCPGPGLWRSPGRWSCGPAAEEIQSLGHKNYNISPTFCPQRAQTSKQKRHQNDWQLTFPLMSCSTMFSGLRSLCMILFSWRYWIPDPAATEQWFLHKDTPYLNHKGVERQKLWEDVPTSLSNERTSLSFRPQQFSGLLSNWNQHKHISITSVRIVHCFLSTKIEKT